MRVPVVLGILFLTPLIALAGDTSFVGQIVPECPDSICRACDLVTLADNLLRFFVALSVFVASLMFAYAGFLYVTASANKNNLETAKKIFWNVFLGFIFILTAWLIVDISLRVLTGNSLNVMTQIQCVDFEATAGGAGAYVPAPGTPPVVGNPVGGGGEQGHDEARAALEQCGYTITSTRGPSQVYASCGGDGCTSLQGLRDNTVATACSLAQACDTCGDNGLLITGGTECGAHGQGAFGHCDGYKVDIEDTPEFRSYVENGGDFTHIRTDQATGYKYYRDRCGNIMKDEIDHFDYQVRTRCNI